MKRRLQLLAGVVLLTSLASANSTTCTISQQCSGGSTISCTGPAGTCSSGPDYVTCNGTSTYCPPPPCWASTRCAYGGFIQCSTDSGSCESGPDYVTCTPYGTLTCDECSPAVSCTIP